LNKNHQTAVVEFKAALGKEVTLGCFVQVCDHANIGDQAVIEGLTIIPSNVSIGNRAQVGFGTCFVTSVSNNERTHIGHDVILGARCVVHNGVSIGPHAVIAPGTIIHRSIPSLAIVEGFPAKIVGYVGVNLSKQEKTENNKAITKVRSTLVRGANLHKMLRVPDIRGSLRVGEFDRDIPFLSRRYFIVFDVPSMETRGEHAHRECHQFLICVRGSCSVVADDGFNRQEFLLDEPDVGIHLSPMVWGIQYKYSPDAVLLVFASDYYDGADYIRDYSEFRQLVGAGL
jgi:acetyltransferase-like isoleucine patch superfamily enzyme